jgi:cysteinyl-tRNA synthetase
VVLSQYRSPLNFNADALSGAKTTLKKLDRFRDSVLECAASAPRLEPAAQAVAAVAAAAAAAAAVAEACAAAAGGLEAAMNDDLNTPRAGASLFGLLKQVQPRLASGELAPASAAAVLACLAAFNAALGVWYDLPDGYFAPPEAVRRAPPVPVFLSPSFFCR